MYSHSMDTAERWEELVQLCFLFCGKRIMSNYLQSLDETGKSRYLENLDLIGLSEEDDPYSQQNTAYFLDCMGSRPPVEFGHIFCYFIERPGIYTKQQILQWKQLEAYNYFQSGFVRTVESWDLRNKRSGCILVRVLVNPSQRTPDQPHNPWIAVKADGQIITAHCTCMAG